MTRRATTAEISNTLNLNRNGGSWLKHEVNYERVVERVRPDIESGGPELWGYLKPQLEAGRRKGFFADSESYADKITVFP